MKIIISPAKKMRVGSDTFLPFTLPMFLKRTDELLAWLKEKDFETLKALWKCNDSIAKQNYERLRSMDLKKAVTPALFSYDGISYQHLAANVMEESQLQYLQKHLYIMSAFYGLLRPFDGVCPYRLEMQAGVSIGGHRNLYAFWGDTLYQECFRHKETVINLASQEYSKCMEPYLQEQDAYLNIRFVEMHRGKLVTKATFAKMARGEMVRYLASKQVQHPDEIKGFCSLGYVYKEEHSTEKEFVFERIEGK